MFDRTIEPTSSDLLASLDWHDPMPLDIAQYGSKTQQRIVAQHNVERGTGTLAYCAHSRDEGISARDWHERPANTVLVDRAAVQEAQRARTAQLLRAAASRLDKSR